MPPVPEVVVYDLHHLTPAMGKKLGAEINALIRRDHRIIDPAHAGPYLERLQKAEEPWLARQELGAGFNYTILDSDEVNAFSHVGGYIYVSCGLFALISSDAALQFVIRHEMAHLEGKHAFHSLETNTNDDEVAARQASGTAQQLYRQIAKGYLEAEEFEADATALNTMSLQLGHSPRQCLAFLRQYEGYAGERPFVNGHSPPRSRPSDPAQDVANHFGAHPAARKRLSRLEAGVNRLGPGPGRAVPN
jgi:predicted Zn-dependent protease